MELAKSLERNTNQQKKEFIMETNNKFECGMCYYQGQAKDFTPITVSADFAALECPNCLNNDKDSFCEVTAEEKLAA
jgi:late competence protein required for DNA uptake (superfamily II DNA/RNA helicase)